MQLNLLPAQAEFFDDITSEHLAFVAGYGSGKTRAMVYKAINLAAHNHGFIGCAMEPTYGMIARNLVPCFEECLTDLEIKYKYEKSEGKLTLYWGGGKSTLIYLIAAENYRRAAGLNLAFVCVDEFDLIPAEEAHLAWKMMQSRIRKYRVRQMCAVSTPEGYKFMYQYFVKQAKNKDGTHKSDRRIIRASTLDNPYNPPEYVKSLMANYPSNLVRAYIYGEFVNLTSGSVYYAFDRVLNGTSKTLKDFPDSVLNIGVDFNIRNMAAVVSCVEKGNVYVVDEIMKTLNTEALIKEVMRRYPDKHIIFYPDSSGNSASTNASVTDIQILRRVPKSRVEFNSTNPEVRLRVGAVNTKIHNGLNERQLFVNQVTCPIITDALETQSYNDKGQPDKSTGVDHPLDALGYFIAFRWPIKGRATVRQIF